jgi:hypothetical protein
LSLREAQIIFAVKVVRLFVTFERGLSELKVNVGRASKTIDWMRICSIIAALKNQ